MFKKLLVANRGEIACRIFRTAHDLGITTVAVYSEADRQALHVSLAHEALCIGGAAATESYLHIPRIIEAAKKTGAQAIHPGYGFLSENPELCRACLAADIVFIGPPVAAIEAMGSKSQAKQIMEKAKVPLVPGYHGDNQDAKTLLAEAKKIGFPVLLKASAGGGGKGMRVVDDANDFTAALESAQREATNAFGDGHMLIEKYLTRPRHVEVQVFCDNHGHGVYLGDRDCSVQRRHQKILEEAPAPGLDASLRKKMGETALRIATTINYQGAGTVEFLLDEDGSFYFMEMNTRLQVEHPVTEMVTGTDLVAWQLQVAAGECLPLAQDQISILGHALEARIYAEDPEQEFIPAAGLLTTLHAPQESAHVRVDTGVRQGDRIGVHYDPMIAKLITFDSDRHRALVRMRQALSEYRVAGVTTNTEFLQRLVSHPSFAAADLDTGFITRHHPALLAGEDTQRSTRLAQAALLVLLLQHQAAKQQARQHEDPTSPWHMHSGWRMNLPHTHQLMLLYRDAVVAVHAQQLAAGDYRLTIEDDTCRACGQLGGGALHADIDDHRQRLHYITDGEQIICYPHGDNPCRFQVVQTQGEEEDIANPGGNPRAPMTGVVVKLLVAPGAQVTKNEPLMLMEAMENGIHHSRP